MFFNYKNIVNNDNEFWLGGCFEFDDKSCEKYFNYDYFYNFINDVILDGERIAAENFSLEFYYNKLKCGPKFKSTFFDVNKNNDSLVLCIDFGFLKITNYFVENNLTDKTKVFCSNKS